MRAYLLSLTVIAALAAPALGQPVSVETELAKGRCRFIADDGEVGDYAEKRCPGLGGARVHTVARPSRVSLSFRWGKARAEDAVQSWSLGTRLEWRGSGTKQAFKPYAAIVTAIVRDQEAEKNYNVLAVIRIAPRDACLIVAIDEAGNKDALKLARATADRLAPTFACHKDQPRVVGEASAWAQEVVGVEGEAPK
jgi:hypothetical protein